MFVIQGVRIIIGLRVSMLRIATFALFVALSAFEADPVAAAAPERYPERPVRLVLPFAPGGPSDLVARLFGEKLGAALDQQIVADNRGGAAGIIALHGELARIATLEDVKTLLGRQGADVFGSTPAEFAALIQTDSAKWGKVISAAHVKVE